jgi:fucose permease
MADRREVAAVYGAGLIQGIALVTFPAASSILTSPTEYDLTSTAYGSLFLPQAVAAIASALASARLTRRLGLKRVFLAGLVGDLVSMSLLVLSQFAIGDGALPYLMLLLATTALGIGFGLAVPALNNLAAGMFPAAADRAVLYLNALLGLGTALAPLLVAVFLGLGVWWGLPLVTAILLVVLIVVSLGLPLPSEVAPSPPMGRTRRPSLPPAFRLFAVFALLYGIVETMNGNWSTVYMTGTLGASAAEASLALTAFWGMVTVGRVLFAAIERWLPEPTVYRLLPFVAALALATTAQLSGTSVVAGVLVFGLAGLGCSALLPLTISFSQRGLTAVAASAAGLIIAFYQVGYGIAAFGVGPLLDLAGISLSALYGVTAIVAVVLGVLAFVVAPRRPRAPAAVPADA